MKVRIDMPTTKKRINLTIPEDVYLKLLAYKDRNGFESDATTCLHLIKRQLQSAEYEDMVKEFIQKSSIEELMKISKEGFTSLKDDN